MLRHFLMSVLCLVGLAAFNAPASAAPLAVEWTGTYNYMSSGSPTTVNVNMHLVLKGTKVTGQMSERATFGDGSSPYLYANIVGTFADRVITFTKTYDGTGGVNHSVQYKCVLSPDGKSMIGFWQIDASFGAFGADAK